MKLRDYQQEAVDSTFTYWERAPSTPEKPASPLIVMPTGSGKSAVIGGIVRSLVETCGARGAILVHRAELIVQNTKAVRSIYPGADIGIVSASLGRREYGHAITIGAIQSVARKPELLGQLEWMLIDESHLVGHTAGGQYRNTIASRRSLVPLMPVVGLTATPSRLGQGLLTEGDDAIFTAVCYTLDIKRLIREAWLAPPITGLATASIDLDGVSITSGGDYASNDLELASDVDKINDAVARDIKAALDSGRKAAMVFATSVSHAARLRNAIRMEGISCEMVTGEMDRAQREHIYAAFKAGKIQCLTSCEVLTTGFDDPHVDVIGIVRATMSPTLFVQMAGRGSRPMYACGMVAPDSTVEYRREQMAAGPKPNGFLLLDYGGNLARHGPLDAIIVKPKSKGGGDAPVKICPQCMALCAASARQCDHCGFEFPAPTRKANDRASTLPALSIDMPPKPPKSPPQTREVGRVEWFKHQKFGDDSARPTLRMEYYPPEPVGVRKIVSEWVCIEHDEGGYAWRKAVQWWETNVGTELPASVDAAIEILDAGYMKPVRAITTQKDGKWDTVLSLTHGEVGDVGEDDPDPDTPLAPADPFADDDLLF
jgi:DNA repair protein RadD